MDRLIKPEWSGLKRLMFLKAASGGSLNEYEITGNPVAFATNVQKPLSGFTIPFLPVQSGTGDPSPENVRPISGWQGFTAWGAGKNLFDPAKTDRSVGYNIRVYKNDPILLPAGTYTMSCSEECNGLYVEKGSTDIFVKYNSTFLTFTLSEATEVSFNFYTVNMFQPGTVVQLEVGDSASPYTEYTGASYPVTFPATGKNLLNISESAMTESGWNRRFPLSIKEGTYTIACNGAMGNEKHGRVNLYDENNASVKLIVPNYSFGQLTDQGPYTFTLTEGEAERVKYLQIEFISSGTTFADVESAYIQIESGESKTAYEPYTNTIYGGTLDAVNGVVTVEYVLWTKNTASMNNEADYPGWKNAGIRALVGADRGGAISAMLNVGNLFAVNTRGNNDIVYFPKSEYNNMTQDDWIELAIDIQIAVPLATPLEIQLDPITVQTLIGDNTIWTDTNGENTVKYLKKG